MGVEDYLLTSTVIGILAQRLVRTLCPHCKEPYTALPEVVDAAGPATSSRDASDITLYHAEGLRAVRANRLHRAGSASWKCCR